MAGNNSGRVKPVSRDKSFAKLRAMQCFEEAHQMLCEGYPIKEVARFIQEDKQEYTEVKRDSLQWTLDAYRATIPKAQLVAKRMPTVFNKAAEQVRKGLDEIEELERLYQLQMERISIDAKNEKNINKLLPTMTAEIKAAKDIAVAIAELKMDLGLSKRHIGQLDVDTRVLAEVSHRYEKPEVAKVMANAESRRKLLGIIDQMAVLTTKSMDSEGEVTEAELLDEDDEDDDDVSI